MFAAGTTTVLLCALAFGARADDNPLAEKVRQVVANFDSYLEDRNLEYLHLPNVGVLPLDPLKLRNGRFGKFSSLEVLDVPYVNQTTLADGSDIYTFDIELGLKEFEMYYDFSMNEIVFKREGNFSISAEKNSMLISGVAMVHSNTSCEAFYKNFHVVDYSGFKIHLEPNDIPKATQLSEYLLNLVTPYMVPFANEALEFSLNVPVLQKGLSDITCEILSL